jgi:hypothetical protein
MASTTSVFLLVSFLLQRLKKIHVAGLLGFSLEKRKIAAAKVVGRPFGEEKGSPSLFHCIYTPFKMRGDI